MRVVLSVLALIAGSAGFVAASAQDSELDCTNPQAQIELTDCAVNEFESADKLLNAQWAVTRKFVAAHEQAFKGGEKALLKAQRSWIGHRDRECEGEGLEAEGGSMQYMIVAECKTRLTKLRTKELKSMAEQP